MRALVLEDVGQLSIKDTARPSPKSGEVVVRVAACGICGSDIPRAYKDGAHSMPLIIGHEFAGVVEEAGAGVDDTWVGKRVGVFPLIPCQTCNCCAIRKYEMCKNYSYLGSRVDGGFAEYVAVPEWNLIELPDKVSMSQAAMLEPMSVAVHAIRQVLSRGDMRRDIDTSAANIMVMGLGTIGLMVTMFLKDMGYKNVYTVGNKATQKRMAKSLGVDEEHYLDAFDMEPGKWISDKTKGLGVDIFFECIGSVESLSTGIAAASCSGVVCTVGNPHSDMALPREIYWKILRHQLTLVGTWNSSFTHEPDDDWHYVLGRLQQGGISPETLITHKYPLSDIVNGFEIMLDKREEYVKVMAEITVE